MSVEDRYPELFGPKRRYIESMKKQVKKLSKERKKLEKMTGTYKGDGILTDEEKRAKAKKKAKARAKRKAGKKRSL